MNHRTQIILPVEVHRRVTKLARRKGLSMAEVIRRAVEQYLDADAGAQKDPFAMLSDLAGSGGAHDVSDRHDEYLYGTTQPRAWGARLHRHVGLLCPGRSR